MYESIKIASVVLGLAVASAGAAQATTLTASTNIDNAYHIYISTDNASAGTSFGSGAHWWTTFTDTVTLISGVTNYLHIKADDHGGIAGLLGEFTLSDTDFAFANGTQELLSGDKALQVSTTGWSGYGATSDLGANGVRPWGTRTGVSTSARWVWSDDANGDNTVFFTAEVSPTEPPLALRTSASPVPLPAALPLLLVAFGGLGLVRRRAHKAD